MDSEKYLLKMLQDISEMNATLQGIQNDIKDIQKIVKKVDVIEEDVKHLQKEVDDLEEVSSRVLPLEERVKHLEEKHKATSGAIITIISALVVEFFSHFL